MQSATRIVDRVDVSSGTNGEVIDTFLVTDVGGTHARIALATAPTGDASIQLQHYRTYRCADYSGLDEILAGFVAECGIVPPRHGVVASAGYALADGSVLGANLPWKLELEPIRQRFGMCRLGLVNDFEAVAHAAPNMAGQEVLHLSGPEQMQDGAVLVLGPGTGLGAALWTPRPGGEAWVLPTEAGQAALAPASDAEFALLQALRAAQGHVSIESLLSGPGLLTLYRTLCALRGVAPILALPAEVSAAAQTGHDTLAREALEIFCGLLGSVVGDMVLLYGIRGGVYLAGGFLPRLARVLAASQFRARMLDKGKMRPALEQVPVKLVEHGQLGVIGAANWFVQQRN
ncbi:MAG: glucokinase [Pseudomonas sp.]